MIARSVALIAFLLGRDAKIMPAFVFASHREKSYSFGLFQTTVTWPSGLALSVMGRGMKPGECRMSHFLLSALPGSELFAATIRKYAPSAGNCALCLIFIGPRPARWKISAVLTMAPLASNIWLIG